jgi:hypothetical protein
MMLARAVAATVACGLVVGFGPAYGATPPTKVHVSHLRHGCTRSTAITAHVKLKHAQKHTRYLLQIELTTGGRGEVLFRTKRHRTFRHTEHLILDGSIPATRSKATLFLYRHTRRKDFPLGSTTASLPRCGAGR